MSHLKGLVLLCAHSARSTSYVQALDHAGLSPEAVILYGEPSSPPQSQRDLSPRALPWFCPDLSISAEQSILKAGWEPIRVKNRELDSETLQNTLADLAPELLVYSGYGGQLVPECLLKQISFLHIHSGMLPRYRGSTTLYHEVLEHSECAASAILLTPTIDAGPVIATRSYPMPPVGMDVDYLYDNIIRADLLLDILNYWHQKRQLPPPIPQSSLMPPYFIIHPLLKHLALKRIDSQKELV